MIILHSNSILFISLKLYYERCLSNEFQTYKTLSSHKFSEDNIWIPMRILNWKEPLRSANTVSYHVLSSLCKNIAKFLKPIVSYPFYLYLQCKLKHSNTSTRYIYIYSLFISAQCLLSCNRGPLFFHSPLILQV